MLLKNKVAIITGGNRGIGAATAQRLGKEGARADSNRHDQNHSDRYVEPFEGTVPPRAAGAAGGSCPYDSFSGIGYVDLRQRTDHRGRFVRYRIEFIQRGTPWVT